VRQAEKRRRRRRLPSVERPFYVGAVVARVVRTCSATGTVHLRPDAPRRDAYAEALKAFDAARIPLPATLRSTLGART
jgi:hypothetical protein